MIKKLAAAFYLAMAVQSVFCQSGKFPMEDYQRAAETRDFTTVTRIIKQFGTNTNYYNDSILYKAVEAQDVELARVLLEAGIPKELDSGIGANVSLTYLALTAGNLDMVKLLMEHYPVHSEDVSSAIERGNKEALNLFISGGIDLLSGGGRGSYFGIESFTYFNVAIKSGQYEIAGLLLGKGHPVNTLDTYQDFSYGTNDPGSITVIHSALDYAAASANQFIKPWLLANGAKSGYEILNMMSLPDIEEKFIPKNRGVYRTTTDDLRYRAEPALTGAVLGLLRSSDILYVVCRTMEKFDIDGMSEYWYYVISDTGKRGWAYGGYITQSRD